MPEKCGSQFVPQRVGCDATRRRRRCAVLFRAYRQFAKGLLTLCQARWAAFAAQRISVAHCENEGLRNTKRWKNAVSKTREAATHEATVAFSKRKAPTGGSKVTVLLFLPQCLDRIEPGRAPGWNQSG